ncbi:MAG: aminotransferase class I/II-fold pyridoxal phosphate-dependent enzyme [Bacillota bacterium]|nr:aminotransferase class I/II-fold pyridoxal phosphate-dependent enzyme [Bacillota bacterium]
MEPDSMYNPYAELNPAELERRLGAAEARMNEWQKRGLSLDLTRGKPSTEQLDMVSELGFDQLLSTTDHYAADGSDCRNYGGLAGLAELRKLFGEWLKVPAAQVIVMNNSSLKLMYDFIVEALLTGLPGGEGPWSRLDRVAVLCPAPGYDRHFALADSLGLELIPVPMDENGPDMDLVEELVKDPAVKLMFAVPQYSNPDGIVYSDEVCRRLATMETAPDFRVIWDNAYRFHHLVEEPRLCPDILPLAAASGHPDRFFEFISTSKISYAGSGIAAVASSPRNVEWLLGRLFYQIIGPDKMNQLRHLRLLDAAGGLEALMERHAELLRPKFRLANEMLRERHGNGGIVRWLEPEGGYFIGLHLAPGLARAVVAESARCGVKLTAAGAAWPHGQDPEDSCLRLAPTYPSLSELKTAMEVLCDAIEVCALRQAAVGVLK